MKRGLTIWQLAALCFFILKGTQTPLFGAVPTWLIVFLPIVAGWVYDAAAALWDYYSLTQRLTFSFWKWNLKRTVSKKTAEQLAGIKNDAEEKRRQNFIKRNYE